MTNANSAPIAWYVARTQPQKEEIARINLERQGIKAFLPRFWKTYRQAKRFEDRLRPVFPGYIFFESGVDPALWRNVSGTLGISCVLWGGGRRPAPVPQQFMADLKVACIDGILNIGKDALKIGTKVQINRGPFTGLLAKVCSLEDRGRVSLFLDVMGGVMTNMATTDVECVA